MMFALFFVLNKYVFYLFLVIFSYSSFTATVLCTRAALRAVSRQSTIRVFAISRFRLEASRGDLAAVIFAAVLVLIWLFNRHASWAWTPLDILGCFFMTMILQVVVLPDGRVATFFLCALVAYDIFMVFITPLFMPHGKSVMVHVARGGSAHEVCLFTPQSRRVVMLCGLCCAPPVRLVTGIPVHGAWLLKMHLRLVTGQSHAPRSERHDASGTRWQPS